MLGCLDVSYKDSEATTALVLFENWQSESAFDTFIQHSEVLNEYIPGSFYKRELPCLLSILKVAPKMPDTTTADRHSGRHRSPKSGRAREANARSIQITDHDQTRR
jgi:deoxyinosine 3'endonuclease (endonuclease V)